MKRAAVVGLVAVLVGGCAIYGRELRSVPSLGPEEPTLHDCPTRSGISYSPPSGGELCYSVDGIDVEVEAENAEQTFGAMGPLLPVIPHFPKRAERSDPLRIEIAFKADERYAFNPWQAVLRTEQGETIGVAKVQRNVREGNAVHTIDVDPHDRGAHMLSERFERFFLTYEKHVGPEQAFSLALRLIGFAGSDIRLQTIRFNKGKLSYFASVP